MHGWVYVDDPTSFQPSSSTERAGKYCLTKLATFGLEGFKRKPSILRGLASLGVDMYMDCEAQTRNPKRGGEALRTLCVASS